MTIPRPLILLVLGPLCFAAGCAQPIRTDRTFRRGVEALAAGSPKAAIPFLTEAVASSPDDAEAHAMLAVAYALALEPDLAIQMVKRVHPDPGTIETPGWEHVALGIAAVVQHRPEDAAEQLRKVVDTVPSPADAKQAASQWLTLTLLLKGDWSGALDSLTLWPPADDTNGARTTALLWAVLVHAHQGDAQSARRCLVKAAGDVSGPRGLKALPLAEITRADNQGLCAAGVAAIRQDKLAEAEKLFTALHARQPNAYDAQVWLALVAAAEGKWAETVSRLKNACLEGPPRSRGLANQLFSVVCALQNRPHSMIHHMLIGQRLRERDRVSGHMPTP